MPAITKLLLLLTVISTTVLSFGTDFARKRQQSSPNAYDCPGVIDSDTRNLYNKIQAFDGSYSTATEADSASRQLNNDLNSCLSTCKSLPVLDCPNSTWYANYLDSTLEPDMKRLSDAVIAKKPLFSGYPACPANRQFLTIWSGLCDCSVSISCPSQQSAVRSACSKILADIQAAVNAYCSYC